ncbi:peptidoglycan-binding protein [Tranquillimonas rosea]|uniref:peptidoglycan-binding domain-containing protein n=1 Tax=Tranquillimonas rosea TaxID=641238 RepID=UPI003BACD3E5
MTVIRASRLFVGALSAGLCAAPAMATDLAVMLGTSDYSEVADVRGGTAVLDARDALEDAGVDVIDGAGVASAGIDEFLAQLEQMAPSADRILVTLSGRFMSSATETYFLPADLEDMRLGAVAEDGLALSTVLAILAQAPENALLVLATDDRSDATGPYLREGLGDIDMPEGVTLARGRPDAIERFLRGTVAAPGVALRAGAGDDVTLSGYAPEGHAFLPGARGGGAADRDDAYWDVATDLDTRDAYEAYLDRYPEGRHAVDARRRVAAFDDPATQAERTETALELSQSERQQVQRDLTVLGFDTRGVEGIFGPGTRSAIRNWQDNNDVQATSYLTAPQVDRIARQAERRRDERAREERRFWQNQAQGNGAEGMRAYLDRFPQGEYAGAARARLAEIEENNDRAAWQRAQEQDTVAGYRGYLDRHPDGRFSEDAQEIVTARTQPQQPEPQQPGPAQSAEAQLGLNTLSRRLMEERLQSMGYNPGRVDGQFDGDARRAIRNFQQQSGLPVTGYVSEAMVARLLAEGLRSILQ